MSDQKPTATPMKVTVPEHCDRCKRASTLELTLAQAQEKEDQALKHEEEVQALQTYLDEMNENGRMPDLVIFYKGTTIIKDKVCDKCDAAVANNIMLARGLSKEEKAEKAAATAKRKKDAEAKKEADAKAAEEAKVKAKEDAAAEKAKKAAEKAAADKKVK
jgi:hypothetical protein